jgi:hypothetical protein
MVIPLGKFRSYLFLVLGLVIVVSYQHCGEVKLRNFEGVAQFASTGFPLLMKAPTQYPVYRRYVLLVDMSNSMISGPCPYDRDVPDSVHGASGPFHIWDPNPTKTDPEADINDHRAVARDCYVNPELTPPNIVIHRVPSSAPWNVVFNHQTYPGADPEADRISAVREWIRQLRENLQSVAAQRVEVMILPVTGGAAQKILDSGYVLRKPEFVNVFDPRIDEALGYLKAKHDLENGLVRMQIIPRWIQTMNLDTAMGTTSPGELLTKIYNPINENYKSLAREGLLTGTSFDIFLFGDGHITPLNKHFQAALGLWGGCSCTGAACTGECSQLWQDMKESWGDPDANRLDAIDFRYSVLQSMPRFYGGGFLDTHLVQIHPDHFKLRTNNAKSEFQSLVELSTSRQARMKIWKLLGPNPPFDLAASRSATTTFKMTHFFIHNPNARVNLSGVVKVDSDGDGLPDDEETTAGTDPYKARTNGYCLDSLLANPTFAPKCESLKAGNGCASDLDSDGDSLNECEEMVLGTDPYDFDTDGDAMPDTLEWFYGYNPLRSDTEMDSNSDGYNNVIAFSAGVPPQIDLRSLDAAKKIQIESNYIGQEALADEQLGSVRVDSYDIRINSIPAAQLLAVDPNQSGDLFLNRLIDSSMSREAAIIHPGHRLIKSSANPRKNMIMGLLRTIDPDEPRRVYWQILEIPFDLAGVNSQRQLDLSRFEQIRVMDRDQEGK